MAETEKPAKKKIPGSGRKGGAKFPRIDLQQSIEYSNKLVAKTHTGALPATTILPGVFGNSGSGGQIRASALKQFGLLEGAAEAYQATPLAKEIEGAPDQAELLQRAFRSAKIFSEIFETYHGDVVTTAKVAQRAKQLNVHPESADECARLFIDSAVQAGLGTMNGESIALANTSALIADPSVTEGEEHLDGKGDEGGAVGEEDTAGKRLNDGLAGRSKASVSINVDSTSDPEKLEKQLKLLRSYGLI